MVHVLENKGKRGRIKGNFAFSIVWLEFSQRKLLKTFFNAMRRSYRAQCGL